MALFSKKDLGLLLPDEHPGDPVSLRHTKNSDVTDEVQELKPRVDPTKKVKRYRAGQVPHFATAYEDERGFVTANQKVRRSDDDPLTKKRHGSGARQRIEAQVITSSARSKDEGASQTRLRHGARGGSASDEGSSSEAETRNALDDSSSEEDDEEVDRRRQALRKKMLEKEKSSTSARDVVEAKVVRATPPSASSKSVAQSLSANAMVKSGRVETESSASSASGSEWETDTDDSDEREVMMKPVFVPKKARGTIKRQEELDAEEERRLEREREKANARRMESRKLVAEELQRERDGDQSGDVTDSDMPDDTDGLDPVQEYRDWELREMRRIKRDRDRREQQRKDVEETIRRRNLTEEERQAEDEKLKKNAPKEKTKLKFMQKYYHKGAFYMDDSSVQEKNDVRKREATGATLEDNFNKEMMPSVMQVKNFGRAGRTKYTHLAAEDTSTKDSLWARNDEIRDKFRSRLSGTRDLNSIAPKKRKTN